MKNQTFGIELEMRHISRADAAAVIAAHFGTRVSHTGGGYDTREIGEFINERGLLFSNGSYTALRSPWATPTKCS